MLIYRSILTIARVDLSAACPVIDTVERLDRLIAIEGKQQQQQGVSRRGSNSNINSNIGKNRTGSSRGGSNSSSRCSSWGRGSNSQCFVGTEHIVAESIIGRLVQAPLKSYASEELSSAAAAASVDDDDDEHQQHQQQWRQLYPEADESFVRRIRSNISHLVSISG